MRTRGPASSEAGPRSRRSEIASLLPRVRRGALSSDDFLRATRLDFERLAAHQMRGYTGDRALPADVGVEDVANRLRFETLLAIPSWDPARGRALGEFALYRAKSRVDKWLNQRRGASKKAAKAQPSRCPLLLADLVDAADAGDSKMHERIVYFLARRSAGPAPSQVEAVAAAELLERLRRSGLEVGESVESALAAFESSPALRRAARAALEGCV